MVGWGNVEMGFSAAYETPPGPLALYTDWMTRLLTLQWGQSIYYEKPVLDVYATRLPVTMAYLVPGVLVSTLLGSGLSTYAATNRASPLNRTLSIASNVGLSIPTFVLAFITLTFMSTMLGWIRIYDSSLPLWHRQNVTRSLLPIGIVAINFFAVQARHARSETTERLTASYVKTAQAKGAGQFRKAIHIFRNMWPSLGSLALGESLGLLFLSAVVIEKVLLIPGIAVATFNGFAAGDPMLSFTSVFGLVLLGVSGTLLQDFARVLLDPRVDD